VGVIENMKELANLIEKAGDLDLYRKIIESEGEFKLHAVRIQR